MDLSASAWPRCGTQREAIGSASLAQSFGAAEALRLAQRFVNAIAYQHSPRPVLAQQPRPLGLGLVALRLAAQDH